jgi:hypothetical protein
MRRLRAEPDPLDNDLRVLTFVALFAVSIPLSFVTTWAYLCWLAAPFISKAEDRLFSRRRAGNGRAGNGQAGNGQAGNGQAGNGQAGERPGRERLVLTSVMTRLAGLQARARGRRGNRR